MNVEGWNFINLCPRISDFARVNRIIHFYLILWMENIGVRNFMLIKLLEIILALIFCRCME